jgi:hypothetical protein
MHRTKPTQSRAIAAAVIGATPTAMLDAIIERAEAVRTRYLGRLSEPQLRTYSRNQYRTLLNVLELRLENLRAARESHGTRPGGASHCQRNA